MLGELGTYSRYCCVLRYGQRSDLSMLEYRVEVSIKLRHDRFKPRTLQDPTFSPMSILWLSLFSNLDNISSDVSRMLSLLSRHVCVEQAA